VVNDVVWCGVVQPLGFGGCGLLLLLLDTVAKRLAMGQWPPIFVMANIDKHSVLSRISWVHSHRSIDRSIYDHIRTHF